MPLPAPALLRFLAGLAAAAIGLGKLEPPGQYALVGLGLLLAASGLLDIVTRSRRR
jgi:hypothetical protein